MIKFVDFKKHVGEGKFKAAYAFIGDDRYLINSAMDMLEKKVELPQLNVAHYGDESDIHEITAAYGQLPMMSDYRLMKFEVKDRSPGELKILLDFVRKNPNPQTLLALYSSELVSALASNVGAFEVVDCGRLDKTVLIKWLANRAAALGVTVDRDAASLLCDYCLNNLARIEVEFDKLADIVGGEKVDVAAVENNVCADGEFKVYELSDAIAKKDTARTYRIYENLIVSTPPVAILGALYSHFRRLLYASTAKFDRDALARYLKVKPFAVDMAIRQSKSYTPKRLKKIVDKLSGIDADFKSGAISDKVALDAFIAEMLCAA